MYLYTVIMILAKVLKLFFPFMFRGSSNFYLKNFTVKTNVSVSSVGKIQKLFKLIVFPRGY
jgi:hypothetical protein